MILERHKTIVPLNSFGASLNVFSSMLKKSIFVATILAASINFAHAEDVVPDKFKIALGGYSVFRYDSTISTIGCGVLVPTTTWSKLFTIIFSILSIGFFVAVIAKIVTIVL